jgi:hypothetical protein
VHLTNQVGAANDLHQNSALPCFLRPMVMCEDVNDLGGKVPTDADTFAHRTVVNSKFLLLQFR